MTLIVMNNKHTVVYTKALFDGNISAWNGVNMIWTIVPMPLKRPTTKLQDGSPDTCHGNFFHRRGIRNEKKEKSSEQNFLTLPMELFKLEQKNCWNGLSGHQTSIRNAKNPITDAENISTNPEELMKRSRSKSDRSMEKNSAQAGRELASVQIQVTSRKDPLLIYKTGTMNLFDAMVNSNNRTISILMRGQIPVQEAPAEALRLPRLPAK